MVCSYARQRMGNSYLGKVEGMEERYPAYEKISAVPRTISEV